MSTVVETTAAEELQRRNRELAALNAISLATSRSLNLEEMLDFSVATILEIVGGEAGGVLLVEAPARRLSVWGQRGLSPELAERLAALTLDGDYWPPAALLDVANLWRIGEAVQEAAREAGLAACTILPLWWRDVALGVLLVGGQEALGRWSIEFLMTVSDQLSLAVRNAQLYREVQRELAERQRAEEEARRRNAELAALNAIAAAASSSLNLQEVLERALDKVLAVAGVDTDAIYLLDQHAEKLVLTAYRGVPKEIADRVRTLPVRTSLAGQAVQSGEPVVVGDITTDPRLRTTLLNREVIRSFAAIPIKSGEKVQGVLHVASRQYHPFSAEEVQFYTAIASEIGVAMENARLYKAASEAKRELENITDSIADGLYTTDKERRITSFNPVAEMLTGWRAEEVLGRFCGDILRVEDEEGRSLCGSEDRCSIYWTLQHGYHHLSWGEKRFIVTKSGTRIPIAKTASPLLDEAGQVVGAVAAFWDASRETKLQQLDKFLSMVSHELLTPLTNIKTAAQLSLRRFDTLDKGTQQELWDCISQQCNSLIGFVEKTLRISYLKTGRLAVERQPFACLPLLEKAVSLYRIGAPGCRFEVWAQGSPWAIGDEAQTAVVLNAILENAVKYSPGGGTIRLEVAEDEAGVLLSIADQGQGISPQDLDHVTEEFYRGQTSSANGYGLGLYLTKMLVEAQGGRIWLESELGKGTQVHFTLPKA